MPIVAIDGPAGAGKSTVARRVAEALAYDYIDTGAMYRAIAWKAAQLGMGADEAEALGSVARSIEIALSPLDKDLRQRVWADGVEVTDAIRTPEISALTSPVSAVPEVRRAMVEQQRRLASQAARGAVLEGRDIGTVVFPGAEVKVYLDASAEERARRRAQQLVGRATPADIAAVLAQQQERDERDSTRADSPLRVAPDAFVLKTDGLDVGEVVERVLGYCRVRFRG